MNTPLTIIFIAYHFEPSTEIGARRLKALSHFLEALGFRVIIVSEFGGVSTPVCQGTAENIVRIRVERPSTHIVDFFVRLKRSIASRNGAAEEPSVLPSEANSERARHSFFSGMANFILLFPYLSIFYFRGNVFQLGEGGDFHHKC